MIILLACATPEADSADPCGRTPPLTYENFGQSFLSQHCTGCHSSYLPPELRDGAPVGVDLNSYSALVQWADRVAVRTQEETMPPGGGTTAAQRAQLQEWLRCDGGVR